ncbi:MAG: hypothetical protein ACI3ZB_08295 [Prevotella sp.]
MEIKADKRLYAFSNGELTEYEFVNACFSAAEQVNEMQSNLLSAAIEVATEGAARAEAKFTWIMSSRDGGRQSQQAVLLNHT